MGTKARSFAFIKVGEFSHANSQLLAQLQARFPDLTADVVDLNDLKVIRTLDMLPLLGSVAREFGLGACSSAARIRRHMLRTPYFYRRTRASLLSRLKGSQHVFTFQTQSLFDASCPGTPHFIYTDHTHLENLRYPANTTAFPISHRWAELERSAYRNASMVFTMSANIARSVVEDYGCAPNRVACVFAGSNVSPTAAEPVDARRFADRHILFVGVDWERKGGPVLLEAFRKVRRTFPNVRLTVVGCAPNIRERGVHIVGRVPLEEVARHYRSASVFCLPTLNEPFGLVFLEAFSYGLPVVATRIGAIPEIVADGKSGYLVGPRKSHELAHALQLLLSDPARCERFGAFGRKSLEHKYSWQETGMKVAAYIEQGTRLQSSRSRPTHAAEIVPVANRSVECA
ncbi:MAG: glycosyltransferase family 4 protein [Sinobacteraceae bacterium]|nr:glycosyltransferase family 4 protein [Nevskiaceae bacterium]